MVIDIIKNDTEFLAYILRDLGYEVREFHSFANYHAADFLICGYIVEDRYSSLQLYSVRERHPDLPILIYTVLPDDAKKKFGDDFPVLGETYNRKILQETIKFSRKPSKS